MDGVSVVYSLLVNDAELIALVPAAKIMAGPLPLNTQAPAISIASVSQSYLNMPSPGASKFTTERVQVTVLARNYPEQKTILREVKSAAADKMPTIAGLEYVTVHTDSAGPDFMNEDASLYLGSQDFRIKFNQEI